MRSIFNLWDGPRVEDYPELTPDLWRRMRCRASSPKHCFCELCVIDASNARALDDWKASQDLRPHQRHGCEFGSVNAALEALLRHRQDGASARSSQGGIQARAEETARLGTHVQTTQRFDRDSLELRRATWAVDVESALDRAFAEPQERRGLGLEQCKGIVLSTVDPVNRVTHEQWAEVTGLSEAAVKGLVSHARRVMTIELVVGGYMPAPRSRAGLDGAIERRRGELDRP